jgi:small neutral amino acid transporter SnatA (MarC family)
LIRQLLGRVTGFSDLGDQVEQQLQAVVTVLSLVNPAICGVMFAQAVAGRSRREQLVDATKAAVVVLAILLGAALSGTRVLDPFGVSLDAFMVAGGGVLAWMGFSMLSSKASIASSPATGSDPLRPDRLKSSFSDLLPDVRDLTDIA